MNNILEIENISFSYSNNRKTNQVFNQFSLEVRKNEFITIVGPSGCGKTTLLNIIGGLTKVSSGEINYYSQNEKKSTEMCAYMFQNHNLLPWYTVYQNLEISLRISKKYTTQSKEKIMILLDKYGLKDVADDYPKTLSGGMQQRVALIRSLLLDCEIILLDEPFSGLDGNIRLKMIEEFQQIIQNEKKTAIMVTHDLYEALMCSDRIIYLFGTPCCIKKELNLQFEDCNSFLNRSKDPRFYDYLLELRGEIS